MTLEFILLFPALMLLPVAGFTNIPYLAVLAVVLALCVPVVRLMRTQGPPFVPTPKKTVEQMMRLADVKQGERVYDLGCGDGRLLIAAAKEVKGYRLRTLGTDVAPCPATFTQTQECFCAVCRFLEERFFRCGCYFLLSPHIPHGKIPEGDLATA